MPITADATTLLVPFATEDKDRLGVHGHALLETLTEFAVAKGRSHSVGPRSTPTSPDVVVVLWVRTWQHLISIFLALPVPKLSSHAALNPALRWLEFASLRVHCRKICTPA
jgi:hypothetical protein